MQREREFGESVRAESPLHARPGNGWVALLMRPDEARSLASEIPGFLSPADSRGLFEAADFIDHIGIFAECENCALNGENCAEEPCCDGCSHAAAEGE